METEVPEPGSPSSSIDPTEVRQEVSEPTASPSPSTSPSPSPVEHPSDIQVELEEEAQPDQFTVQPEIEEPDEFENGQSVAGSRAETVEHDEPQAQGQQQPPFGSTPEQQQSETLHIQGEPVHVPDDIPTGSSSSPAAVADNNDIQERLEASRVEIARLQEALAAQPEKNSFFQLQSEKRDLLAVISQLTADKTDLEEHAHQESQARFKANEAVRELENNLAVQADSERSARLKLQQAESRVALLQQDRDWHKEEWSKTNEAYQQYRSQSHSQLSSLQNRLELSQRNEASASTSLAALKSSHNALEKRLVDTLAKNAELTSKLVESQAAFKADIDASQRLTETLNRRDQQAQARLEAVEKEWAEARNHIQSKEAELIQEVEAERQRADEAQRKMEELAQLVDLRHPSAPTSADDMSNMTAAAFDTSSIGANHTPARTNGAEASFGSPSMMLFSPAASLASRAQRVSGAALNSKSYSELYTSYISSQTELTAAQAECRRLSDCLAGVLNDLEERAPLLAEQRTEVQRLRQEQEKTGADLARALDDRDHEARRAESLHLDLEAAQTENALMARQLRDCGRQLRELLRIVAETQDTDMADREPDFDVEAYESHADDEVDTQAVISSHLVTYTSVSDLQRQNTVLLRLTREMGAKMDEQDRQLRLRLEDEGNASVSEAHQLLKQMRQQLADLKKKLDTAEDEREMLRRALGHPQTTASLTADTTVSASEVATKLDTSGYDVQASFDTYRAEVSHDLRQLREELATMQQSHRSAESEAARCRAQLEFAQERVRLASETQELSKTESADLNRQIQRLQTSLAKQDHEVHHAQEQILNLKSERDSLTHELSNIKAEREAWKRMEERLTEDQSRFSTERAELKDTIRQLQHEQHTNERAIEQGQKQMEQHLTRVDRHLEETKARLSQKTEMNREIKLKSDLAAKESQRRIEQLTSTLAHRQEQLAVAQSTQRHLEQRIIDLGAAISAKDDKLGIYEGRLTGAGTARDPSVPREQQLELELAHLRASLRAADLELRTGREQVEAFKASSESSASKVAQAEKEAEEVRVKLEAEVSTKESEITSLQGQIEAVTAELNLAREEIKSLHDQQGVAKTDVERQLAEAQAQLSQAQADAERAQQEASTAQIALNHQLESARSLNSSYLVEQASHAENLRRLEAMGTELVNVRQARLLAEQAAQSNEVSLRLGKENWENQRAALQREIDSSNERYQELKTQNDALHQHLATLTEQSQKLRSTEDEPKVEEGDESQLPKILEYLRNQQQLLEQQLQFERQEKARLSAALQNAEERLEESRSQLTQERLAVGNAATTSAQTEEMVTKVQELTLLRQSNETLRAESSKSAERAQSLADKCGQLETSLAPLREQVAALEAEIETRDGQIKLLEVDNARWKARNEQVLVKYDRIDPQELQALKDKASTLEQEKQTLQEEYNRVRTQAEGAQQRFKSIQATAKNQRDALNNKEKELEALRESSAAATGTAEKDLAAKEAEWRAQREALEKSHAEQIAQTNQQMASLKEQITQLQSQDSSSSSAHSDLQNVKLALEAQVAALTQQLEAEKQRSSDLEEKLKNQPDSQPAEVDSNAIQVEVEKRLAALLPQNKEGEEAIDLQQVMAAERTKVVEENTKRLEDEHRKAISEQTTAHEAALQELRQQVEAVKADADSQTAKATANVQVMQKKLRESFSKVRELEAVQKDLADLQQQFSTMTSERDAARQREQELQKQVEEAAKKGDNASGLNQQEVDTQIQQRVQEAVQAVKDEHETALAAAIKAAEQEKESKLAATKAMLSSARSLNKSKQETIDKLQAQLKASAQSASGGSESSTSAGATSGTPSQGGANPTLSAAAPVFSIKGQGGAKPSDLPPMPGQKKKAAQTKAPGAATATPAPTPAMSVRGASSPARRGRGAGRGAGRGGGLLSSAIGAAVDQGAAGGATGVKRTREDGGNDSAGEEPGQKRRAGGGRGTPGP